VRREDARALRALEDDLRGRGRRPKTLIAFGRLAARFLAASPRPLAKLRKADLRKHLAERARSGICARTQAGELVALRTFFRALVGAGLCESDPTEGLYVKVPPQAPQLFLSPREIRALFQAASTPVCAGSLGRAQALRNRALVELLYGVGLRASEAVRVLVVDLDLREGAIGVRPSKRGVPRSLPLPKAALPHLERYLAEGRPRLVREGGSDKGVFVLGQYGRPLGASYLWQAVTGIAKRAGSRAHPHALRRSLASDLLRAGVNAEAVRQMLGHRCLTTTALYLDVSRDEQRRAVAALDLGGPSRGP
jgi:site-specific recombinase XerD